MTGHCGSLCNNSRSPPPMSRNLTTSQLTIKSADEGVTICSGIVTYSTRVSVPVNPCCENTMCRVVDQFNENKINYIPGATNTNGALKVT